MKNHNEIKLNGPKYLIRLDDIAHNMKWDMYKKVKNLFNKYNIKPIIGVIPDNKDPKLLKYEGAIIDFWKEIKENQSNGWEIAMHGYQHRYETNNEKNLLEISGGSEFSGHSYKVQLSKIENAKKIFEKNNINVKVFFAPNHNFDDITIRCLLKNNIQYILDGYGLAPFYYNKIRFIPNLVGKLITFPFGLHTSVHHLNNYNKKDFEKLEKFIISNKNNIISFNESLNIKNKLIYKILVFFIKYILIYKRKIFYKRKI